MPRLTQNTLLLGCLIAFTNVGFPRPASAQVTYPGIPQQQADLNRPKLSPYLNLLRNDDSLLNPYFSFVVPRRDVNQRQAWQAVEIKQLTRVTADRAPTMSSRSSRLPTGNGGRFQSYLHFYGSNLRP